MIIHGHLGPRITESIQTLSTMYMTATHRITVTMFTQHATVKHVSKTKNMHWYITCKCKQTMSNTDYFSIQYRQTGIKSETGILTTIKKYKDCIQLL